MLGPTWHCCPFAVHTLLRWYSTYLGHVSPASRYWYLSAAPELMALAAERLQHAQEVRS